MIPQKGCSYLYAGQLVKVVDILHDRYPTGYVIHYTGVDGQPRSKIVDELSLFVPLPDLPRTMSRVEELEEENARLREDINRLTDDLIAAHDQLVRYKKDEDRRSHLFDI